MPVWTFMVPPSSVLPDREVEEEGNTHRAHIGPNIPRSRGESPIQRVSSRHERGGPCSRWEAHRGSSSRPPALFVKTGTLKCARLGSSNVHI